MKWWRFVFDAWVFWLWIIALGLLTLSLWGCIPVTIRPQFDDKGLPRATPVTLVGSQDLTTGAFLPIYPVSHEAPVPPKDWAPLVEQGLSLALGLLLGGGTGAVLVRRAKAALGIACRLADSLAVAETDADVAAAKMHARLDQGSAGVHVLTQRVRAKGRK